MLRGLNKYSIIFCIIEYCTGFIKNILFYQNPSFYFTHFNEGLKILSYFICLYLIILSKVNIKNVHRMLMIKFLQLKITSM